MASSIRDYAILYIRGTKVGGTIVGGGNAVLATGQHALDGPEHTGQLPIERLSTDETDTTLVLHPDGVGSVEWGDSAAGLPWFDMVVDGGLDPTGATDNAALIEAAWDLGTLSGMISRTFFWPEGVYKVSRALQDTGAWNAQVRLPFLTLGSSDQIVITNIGPSRPGFEYFGSSPEASGFAVIKSTLTGASGTASCIGGGDNGAVGSAHWNNIATVWENLLFEAPDNPTFTMLNLRQTQGGALRNVQISTAGGFAQTPVLPTHSNAYGVTMPEIGTSNYTEAVGLSVGGFYTAVKDGELVTYTGLVLGICVVCLEIPHVAFPSTIVSATFGAYNYGIRATGATLGIRIRKLTCAHNDSGDFVTVYDLDDPSNYLTGTITHYVLNNTTAAQEPFTVNGGTGVWHWSDDKLGPASGVTPATYGGATSIPQLVIDAYGRVTSATDIPASGGNAHAHVVSENHLSNGSTTTYTLDEAFEPGSVIAWNTTTLARLGVTETAPDQATVSAAGSSGDTITFDYAATVV